MDGKIVLREVVAAYQTAPGDRLLGAYALGSLAHGGFTELVSDVDLGLIISDPLHPDNALEIDAVASAEKARGPELRTRLSVFWDTPSTLRGEKTRRPLSRL
jgi:predicted nucleotidyltransferase